MDRMRYSHRTIPTGCFVLFIALFFSFIILPAVTSASGPRGEKQVGVFGVEENAQALRNRLELEGKYAFLRKKEVNGKTLYAVIVRVSEEAPAFEAASKEAVEPEQEAMADEAAAPAKELTEIEALMAEAIALADKALADEAPAPPAEPMEAGSMTEEVPAPEMEDEPMEAGPMSEEAPATEMEDEPVEASVEMEQADADMMEDEAPAEAMEEEVAVEAEAPDVTPDVTTGVEMPAGMAAPMPAEPAEEPTYLDSPAVSHPVDMTATAPAPSPAPPAREEEPAVESQLIPIKGFGVVFDIHIKGRARLYEGPSFRSRRMGYQRDVGDVQVVSETRSGWIVVRVFVNDKLMYVPGDDVTYFSLDRKGRRKKMLKERPEIK